VIGLSINNILDTDVFLVSYPRSGNTWMRNIIAEIIYGESGDTLAAIGEYIPDIYKYNIDEMHLKYPRVIKSHSNYTKKYKRIIYLVRDPRDVFISFYKYLTQLNKYHLSFKDFVIDICAGNIWPGSWSNHVNSWLHNDDYDDNKKNPDLMLIKYEDILRNRRKQIIRIANFLGIKLNKNTIEKIIFQTSRIQMKKKEKAGGFVWLPKNLEFINKATHGNWKVELHNDMIKYINKNNKKEMNKLGYLTIFNRIFLNFISHSDRP
jgi:hypothetical protein